MDQRERERLSPRPSTEKQEKGPQKPEHAKNVQKQAQELLHATDSGESAEGQEDMEADGRVSEGTGEDKSRAPVGGSTAQYTDDQIEAIRAKLLANLPTPEIMIKQIRKKLNKEEKVLTKRMAKLQKKSHLNAYQLTQVVAKLRKIREYFAMLARATFEMIKHLWLKIVHGV